MKNSSHSPLVDFGSNHVVMKYPCVTSSECSAYEFTLPSGRYLIELYGGSGGSPPGKSSSTARNGNECYPQSIIEHFGGNTVCNPANSAGSGGYISGVITLYRSAHFFAHIGGSGRYLTNELPRGGYNGGGDAKLHGSGCSSGGGATDLRVEVDNVFHRIIVAGGGGGCDNDIGSIGGADDGSGGSGGYPEGQGFWIGGVYNSIPHASQLYGFSFGQGESYIDPRSKHPNSTTTKSSNEAAGAGGGWFGGFISGHANGGGGGGSSFILTHESQLPSQELNFTDGKYNTIETGFYAYSHESIYAFSNISHALGIWSGNGQMKITLLSKSIQFVSCNETYSYFLFSLLIVIISILSN